MKTELETMFAMANEQAAIEEINRELLAACKLALTLLGTDGEAKNGCPSPEELASDLRAAIAKAEGCQ